MMKEEFTQQEREAVFSVISALVKSDYRTKDTEHQFLVSLREQLSLAPDYTPIPKQQLESRAYDTLKVMSKDKKREFSKLMTETARSDGHFGPSERAFVLEILEMCNIPFVHK